MVAMKQNAAIGLDDEELGDVAATSDMTLADPFAMDFFATSRAPVGDAGVAALTVFDESEASLSLADVAMPAPDTASPRGMKTSTARRRTTNWHQRLPRLTRDEARRSAMLAQLPAPFSGEHQRVLAGTIARNMHVADSDVSLTVIDSRESQFLQNAHEEKTECVRAVLSIEPIGAALTAEMEASFAAALADRMLGGGGLVPQALRLLQTTELAIIEFLWLSVVGQMNNEIGEPLFKLHSVGTREAAPPAPTVERSDASQSDTSPERTLLVTVRVAVKTTRGLLRLHLGESALAALSSHDNPLLNRRRRVHLTAKMMRILPEVPLAVCIGRTTATRDEISNLEYGDVVLVKHPEVRWRRGGFGTHLHVRAGDAYNVMIFGEQVEAGVAEGAAATDSDKAAVRGVGLRIGTISGGHAPTEAERLKMENEKNEEETGSAAEETAVGSVLEGLMLTLRVELPARRIRLDELASLRTNQIIDLECLPTDSVELIADGKRLARGELVDIEGRLGVRITDVFE